MTTAPPQLASAFDAWLKAQREAVELVLSCDQPGAPADWAEGYRWVTRLASLALEWFVEKGDPLRPTLFRAQDEFRKLMVDNPDVGYRFTPLVDSETYRFWGTRGDAPYLGITIGTDLFRPRQPGQPVGTLSQHYIDQFTLGPDGEFEIFIGPTQRSGNWIKLESGAGQMSIRETFFDKRTTRHAVLNIERVGPPLPPPALDAATFATKLELASLFVAFVARTCCDMWEQSKSNLNRIAGASGAHHVRAQEDQVRSHSDSDMVYMGGRWKISPDEALVVRIQPPEHEFLYWGLTLVNPWMESYDYRFANVATNNKRANADADGAWTIGIAARDPGLANWLDTGGRHEGFMLLRWVLAGDRPPTPTTELVPLSGA